MKLVIPSQMPTLSLVVPCYCEEPHLEANIDRVVSIFELCRYSWEIILVDDRSPDNTRAVIEKILAKYPNKPIRAVFHIKNEGRGAAFMSGFAASSGNIVGFFDIDLEVSPVYFLECLQALNEKNADLVVGDRHYNLSVLYLHRFLLSTGYHWIVQKLLGLPTSLDTESGYKFFKRETLAEYVGVFQNQGWFWDTEVVCRFVWDKKKVVTIPCLFIRNSEKKSTVKPLRDAIRYLVALYAFLKSETKVRKAKGLPDGRSSQREERRKLAG